MLSAGQLPYVLAGVVLMTLQPMLVTFSQNEQGKLEYNPVSSTLLSEVGKLALSAALLRMQPVPRPSFDPLEAMHFAVPAAIYFVNNNLVFWILTYVNATTFQLLSQLKTVFTGLLFRAVLGRRLTAMQSIAIWQLAAGTAVSNIHCEACVSPHALSTGGAPLEQSSVLQGTLLSVVSCLLSACGGIYSEKLLKDKAKDSIHWQNMQLYAWGILFNFLGAVMNDTRIFERGLLVGYNRWAYLVVLNNALNGLAVSAILKYADNIARVYAHAAAMIATMVLSVIFFGERPTPQLLIAVAIVGASALQYNLPPEQPASEPPPSLPGGGGNSDRADRHGVEMPKMGPKSNA